jgi:hypothetical protein
MNEQEVLCQAVDEFAEKMKARLLRKYRQGFRGWDTGQYDDSIAHRMSEKAMRKNCSKKSLVDIANFAMMLWKRRGML